MPLLSEHSGGTDNAPSSNEPWSAELAREALFERLSTLDAARVAIATNVKCEKLGDTNERTAVAEKAQRVKQLSRAADLPALLALSGTAAQQREGVARLKQLADEAWSRAGIMDMRTAQHHPLARTVPGRVVFQLTNGFRVTKWVDSPSHGEGFDEELLGHALRAAGSRTPATEAPIVYNARHWEHILARDFGGSALPPSTSAFEDLVAVALAARRSNYSAVAPELVFTTAAMRLQFHQRVYDAALAVAGLRTLVEVGRGTALSRMREEDVKQLVADAPDAKHGAALAHVLAALNAREDPEVRFPWYVEAATLYLESISDADGARDWACKAVRFLGHRVEELTHAAREKRRRDNKKVRDARKEHGKSKRGSTK